MPPGAGYLLDYTKADIPPLRNRKKSSSTVQKKTLKDDMQIWWHASNHEINVNSGKLCRKLRKKFSLINSNLKKIYNMKGTINKTEGRRNCVRRSTGSILKEREIENNNPSPQPGPLS